MFWHVNKNPEQAIGSAGRGSDGTEYLGTGGLFLLYDTRRGLMRGSVMIQGPGPGGGSSGVTHQKQRSNDVC